MASSVTAFIVGSILFFIIGFLCGHFCRWEKKVTAGAVTEPEKIHAPYYDDIVLKQQQQQNQSASNFRTLQTTKT